MVRLEVLRFLDECLCIIVKEVLEVNDEVC